LTALSPFVDVCALCVCTAGAEWGYEGDHGRLNVYKEFCCLFMLSHSNAWFPPFRCRSAVAVAGENGNAGNVFPYT